MVEMVQVNYGSTSSSENLTKTVSSNNTKSSGITARDNPSRKVFNDEVENAKNQFKKTGLKDTDKHSPVKLQDIDSNKSSEINESNLESEDVKIGTAKEEVTKDNMECLINLIMSLMNFNIEGSKETSKNSSNLSQEGISDSKVDMSLLVKLMGSEEGANNLLAALDEISLDSSKSETFTQLIMAIGEKNDSSSLSSSSKECINLLKEFLTSENKVSSDSLIGQLQSIVASSNNEGENIDISLNPQVLIKDIISQVKGANTNSNTNSNTNTDENLKSVNNNVKDVISQVNVTSSKSDENLDSKSSENKFSKETQILNKVINGNEGESKVTRAADFMSVFENKTIDTTNVSNEKPIAMTKSDLNNDVIKAVSYMEKNGVKNLTVKIYPKELGEVSISVSMEQGTLKAMIKATSKEASELLNLALNDINEKLNNSNIKIESVNIGIYEDDTTYFSDGHSEEGSFENNNGGKNEKVEEKIAIEDIASEVNNEASNGIDLLV